MMSVHPPLLPAGHQVCSPLRVGRAVVAHVDGGWRALEGVKTLGVLGEVGHALRSCRAGADDADAFDGEVGQSPVGIAARVRSQRLVWNE